MALSRHIRKLFASGFVSLSLGVAANAGDGRIEISQDMMPYDVDQPGSYVVTENLTGSAASNGITISADDVTIDLNGFALTGVPNSKDGISAGSNYENIKILNGSIQNWGEDGIDISGVTNAIVRELRVSHNADDGMRVGYASRVSDCTLLENTHDGLVAQNGSIVARCVARDNSDSGLVVGNGCTVRDSVSRQNSADGISAGEGSTVVACTTRSNGDNGIQVGRGSLVTTSVGYANDDNGIWVNGAGGSVINCSVFGNSLYGIRVGDGCSIMSCTASGNAMDSFYVSSNCYVFGNNSFEATNSGFRVAGDRNRIDRNHATHGATGYSVTGSDNLIIRNSASGNSGTSYSIGGGNDAGGLETDPSAASAGPWDNFSD
jgi:hypothetical protein